MGRLQGVREEAGVRKGGAPELCCRSKCQGADRPAR